ncbi:hypothetical protein [Mannheimia bovis]|uniref:Uncharacterized protein n=1 Tax=Mannheimia bovis TaxID=2770636 RepID=A0A7H1C431_9PAST|nr:hypothetical protein [Mannheimia bovis]QNS15736.1 hypothetical protein ICJ55_03010 [Mannheimia bovis]
MTTFNNKTNGSHSPIISGNIIQGNINLQNTGKNSKKFIDCSDEELLDYGLDIAERFKQERRQKRQNVMRRIISLIAIPFILLILAVIYTLLNSQDKHILDIAIFICGVLSLIITYASYIAFTSPNVTEKDYIATRDSIIRE